MKARCREDKEREAKLLIKAIVRALTTPKDTMPSFVLKKHLKGCKGHTITGYWQEDTEEITLAVYADIIPTIIHELIHYLKPTWSETKVISSEKVVRHYITIGELIKILKLFVKHL